MWRVSQISSKKAWLALCKKVIEKRVELFGISSITIFDEFDISGHIPSDGQQREGADRRQGRVSRGHRRLQEVVEGPELARSDWTRPAHNRGPLWRPRWITTSSSSPAPSNGSPASSTPPSSAPQCGLDPEGEARPERRIQIFLRDLKKM